MDDSPMNQLTADQIQAIKAEADQHRAAFHREWTQTIQAHASALESMPKASLAYEIAWKAFLAGRKSRPLS